MELLFRRARREDVGRIVALLADDSLGADREDNSEPVSSSYLEAFSEMDSDPRIELIVVEIEDLVIGCLQLTIVRGLSHQGAKHAYIEAVRIDSKLRSRGIGERLIHHAIERARDLGCSNVQLTTHRSRTGAHRFYDRLGFEASHVGYKLSVENGKNLPIFFPKCGSTGKGHDK